jgi:hypothetical protein
MKRFAMVLMFLLGTSCVIDVSHVGDRTASCRSGETCTCDGLGDCRLDCVGGGCHFVCSDAASCSFDCPGGGCDMKCDGVSDCALDCAGGRCTSSCDGPGHCAVN